MERPLGSLFLWVGLTSLLPTKASRRALVLERRGERQEEVPGTLHSRRSTCWAAISVDELRSGLEAKQRNPPHLTQP